MRLAHPLAMVQTKFLEVFQGLRMAQNSQRYLQPPYVRDRRQKKSQLEPKFYFVLGQNATSEIVGASKRDRCRAVMPDAYTRQSDGCRVSRITAMIMNKIIDSGYLWNFRLGRARLSTTVSPRTSDTVDLKPCYLALDHTSYNIRNLRILLYLDTGLQASKVGGERAQRSAIWLHSGYKSVNVKLII